MKDSKQALLLILDGFGIGEAPDAAAFGDEGSDTFGKILERFPDIHLPHLLGLGLQDLKDCPHLLPAIEGSKWVARLQEVSAGKDTTTGHWEMMGAELKENFDVFEKGFPQELVEEFCRRAQVKAVLGNCPASGTQIIEEFGDEHLKSGSPILYTSADSVFQLAAHEQSFGRERLYEICESARKLLDESSYQVGRVIARPFVGESSKGFRRTEYRKDFSIKPPEPLFLDKLQEEGLDVIGFGKVPSIYANRGFTESIEGKTDQEAMENLMKRWEEGFNGLCFVNLNELDSLYAHRRNPEGYREHLEWIDTQIGEFLKLMEPSNLLLVSADHGNDPTFKGSDHTREFVPLIGFQKSENRLRVKGTKKGFFYIAQSLASYFNLAAQWHSEHLFDED